MGPSPDPVPTFLDLSELLDGAEEAQEMTPNRQFDIRSFDEMLLLPPKEWLVNGLIAKGDLVMMFGPSKKGKSFIALDLCGSLITGAPFAGEYMVAATVNVVYAAGEGIGGLPGRLKALLSKFQFNQSERRRFLVARQVPQLYDESSPLSIDAFVEQFKKEHGSWLEGGVLIIDTWARAVAGANENDTGDTTLIIDALMRAQVQLNCTIIVIHHSNKAGTAEDGLNIRGSTNIPASFDAVFHTRKSNTSAVSGVFGCGIAKDSGGMEDMEFMIRPFNRVADNGETHSSASIEWISQSQSRTRLSELDHTVLEQLRHSATDVETALTVKEISDQGNYDVSESSLRSCLRKLCRLDLIKSARRKSVDVNGRPSRQAEHFYVREEQNADQT